MMMRVILCGLLALLLAGPAAAQTTATLQALDLSGDSGGVADGRVGLSALSGADSLAGVKVCLAFDPTLLQPEAVVPAALLSGTDFAWNVEDGLLCVSAVSATAFAADVGELFTVTWRVDELARDGDACALDFVDTPAHPLQVLRHPDDAVGIKTNTLGGVFTTANGIACDRGDVNADQRVDSGDAVLALRIAVGLFADPSLDERCRADATLDRRVDAGDAVWILREAVGLPHDSAKRAGAARARLEQRGGDLALVIEGAAVHGLQVQLGFDAARTDLGAARWDGALAASAPSAAGLASALARATAASEGAVVRWPLASVADAVVRLEGLTAFDAAGRPLEMEVEAGSLALTGSQAPRSRSARLLPNAPNPFNPATTIRFVLPWAGEAEVAVFDVQGRRVATLARGFFEAGEHEVTWNGRDKAGRTVASGLYLARLVSEGGTDSRRMLLAK